MKTARGSTRLVIVCAHLGFVIKIPFTRLDLFGAPLLRALKEPGYRPLFLLGLGVSRARFMKGIHANWSEFLFFLKCRNLFLTPTYFSLFGLVNIQRWNAEARLDVLEIRRMLGGAGLCVPFPSHLYGTSKNFGVDENGYLRIRDYADPLVQKAIVSAVSDLSTLK